MRLVFFDIETGGLDPLKHPIIQIAAIAVDEGLNELETFEAKVDFDMAEADQEALLKNSYSREVWDRESRPALHVCDELTRFLKRYADVQMTSKAGKPYKVAQLIGHNSDSFDGPFLQNWYKRMGQFMPAAFRTLCTYQLAMHWFHSRAIVPENYKLEGLCKFFSIPLENAHDALADVRATVAVYRALKANQIEARKAIEAMVPWALIGLAENHPAIQYARSLGVTAGPAATEQEMHKMAAAVS